MGARLRSVPKVVVHGGTGLQAMSTYSVLLGGTTTTGALQQVSGLGTLSPQQFLASNGNGAKPTWKTISFTDNTGVYFTDATTTGMFRDTGSGSLLLKVGGTTFLSISTAGQVDLIGNFTVSIAAGLQLTVGAVSVNVNVPLVPNADNSINLGDGALRWQRSFVSERHFISGVFDSAGSGSPEGVVSASIGSTYRDTTGGDFYVKGSGAGNTGWQIATLT